MSRLGFRCILAGLFIIAGSAPAVAQVWTPAAARRDSSTLRTELRLDWFGEPASALHAGAGLSARAGNYVRIGVNAGAGQSLADSVRNRAHADVTVRFMLDPFRQQPVGLSLGGGISARYERDRIRAFALFVVDAEAGRGRSWTPFVRLGMGGGVRAAAGIRKSTRYR